MFETARSETPDNITFRLTNVIPKRIIFVSRGITVHTTILQEKTTPINYTATISITYTTEARERDHGVTAERTAVWRFLQKAGRNTDS
jgi:hypothetical protein